MGMFDEFYTDAKTALEAVFRKPFNAEKARATRIEKNKAALESVANPGKSGRSEVVTGNGFVVFTPTLPGRKAFLIDGEASRSFKVEAFPKFIAALDAAISAGKLDEALDPDKAPDAVAKPSKPTKARKVAAKPAPLSETPLSEASAPAPAKRARKVKPAA